MSEGFDLAADFRSAIDPCDVFRRAIGTPDLWQQMLMEETDAWTIVNASRQVGKSETVGAIAARRALYFPESLILVTAPSLRQSQELYLKIRTTLRKVDRTAEVRDESSTRIGLRNGSRIVCLPGSEKTIRSFSAVDLILADEAARLDPEVIPALSPMLATKPHARLILLSTPWVKAGSFYDLWTERNDFLKVLVPWYRCPRITPEFIEKERRRMSPFQFAREYECTFGDAEDGAFAEEKIAGAVTSEISALDLGTI
jgi:hypothetical protein